METTTLPCVFCGERKPAKGCQVMVANELEGGIIMCEECSHTLSGFFVILCGKCKNHIALEWDAVISRAQSRKMFLEVLRDNCGKKEMIFVEVVYGCPHCEEGNPWAIFHGMRKKEGGKK